MYDVKLIQRPSGRTHQVGGVFQAIVDEATGEPELEYVLVAVVDGHAVPLESYTSGYVQHQIGRDDTKLDESSSSSSSSSSSGDAAAGSSSEPAATPAEGEGTAGEGAAQQPAPAAGTS
jgi:hypothetical protein